MSSAILIENLSKSYSAGPLAKKHVALNGISLAVEQGEAFGFIGPNGAGKSTTIKILTGALQATSGTASINGLNVNDPACRRSVGYVPENPWLFDYLTPLEIVEMGMCAHGLATGKSARARSMEWLARFGLERAAKKKIREFSKGMAQRTALAHAFALNPKLLILDEPLSGLDPLGRREVMDVIEEFHQKGGTVFFSSHVLYDVQRLANRYGLIHEGKLRTIQTPQQIMSGDDQIQVFSCGETELTFAIPLGGMRWRSEIRRSDLWGSLEALKQAGHEVLEIKPSTSLEDVFVNLTKRSIT